MKTKLKRVSKRTIALFLCFLMLISALGLGSLITAYADNSVTFYIYPSDLWSDYASYTIKANANIGDNNTWRSYDFTDTGKTINGKAVYEVTIQEKYGGVDALQIQKYQGSTWKDEKKPYSSWTQSSTFSGKIYNGSTWANLPAYDVTSFVVAGDIASNGWDNTADEMTKSGDTYSITYSNKAAGSYTFAVVGFDDWNTSYRWAAKGTLTANGAGSWADANDNDNNIKLTLSVKSNVTITLTSDKKVNVTINPLAHSVTRTAPTNGTLQLSSNNSTWGTSALTINEGSNYYVKATPNAGYKIKTLTVGGSTISAASGSTSAYTYTGTMGTSDVATSVTFEKRTYTVTYNKGSNGTGTNTTATKTHDTALTLKGAIFTRTGYTQTGWNTNSSGSGGTHYDLSGSYTANAAVTLYPEWTPKTYTITYKDGGNTDFSGTHASGYPTSYTYGAGATLKSASKDNYIFGGWFDNSSCTGTAVTSISTTATGNKTYYAKWTLAATPQLASISDVSKTVNDTSFNVSATINNSSYASGTLSVTASSGTTSVATVGSVSKSGDNVTIPLTVKGPGTSTITVTLKDGSTTVDTKTFTVTVAEPTFTIAAKTIYAHSKDVAACTVTNGGTAPSSIAWSSGTTANVAVNASTGKLTAKKINSSSTITATATYACGYTKSATAKVTVANPTLTIKAGATSGVIGTTTTASVDSSSNPTVSTTTVASYAWTTSNSAVVGLSSTTAASPTLTFKKAGTATIGLTVTYKNNNLTKTNTNTLTITVTDASITLTSSLVTLNVNEKNTRTATGSTVGSAASTTMEYSGTNEYISVNSTTGEVTALKPTSSNQTVTATYTVTCGGQTTTKTATYTVNVNTPTITMLGQTVAKGDSVTFSAATTNPTGLTIAYSLKSAVSGVSINSSTGVVTVTSGCTATSATVVATAKNSAGTAVATKEATLTIQAPSVTLTNTNIADGTTIYATVGTNVTSTASNNFSGSYTVSSSKTSVATVTMNNSKLTITPVAKGKTTITVTAYKGTSISVTKTFTVKVAEAETYKYLYFTNGVGYTTPKVYFYGDGENGTFPGETMVKIGQNNDDQDVYAIRYPATKNYTNVIISDNGDNNKRVQINSTTDIALSSEHNAIWCDKSKSNDDAGWWDCNISRPQVSIDDISDLPITTTTTMTAELLNNVVPSSYSWSSDTPANVTVSNTTTATNTLTGVYPGTSTITVRAYSPLPADDWTFETTAEAAEYIAGTATATVTTTATPKSVTWGNKVSTDNGSTYVTTNASGAGTVTVSPTMTNGGTVAHGTSVKFTATTNNGYKFAGWQVNGTNSITSTTTKTVQITENTTVYALYYKTYTVTLTRKLDSNASTAPFKTTQYRNAASGNYSTYSSTLTVNAGSPVYFKVSYNNGYQYSSVTNATVETANTVFKIAAVSANTTVTLTATKINYTISTSNLPSGIPSGNAIKVKKGSGSYATSMNNAQVGDTIDIQVTTTSGYYLKSFIASAGTAPSIPSTGGNGTAYNMTFTMPASSVTFTATFAREVSATFYIDVHGSTVNSSNALEVRATGGTGQSTAVKDHTGADCIITYAAGTLTKQGTSTVYSGTLTVPITGDTAYFAIKYKTSYYYKTLTADQIANNGEVWLEAANDPTVEKRVAYATNTTTSVTSGNKRIYVAKPYDWQDSETAWENIGLYHWGDYADMGWANAYKMHYIGHDNDYHYYYYDIPTEAKYIIFQGWGNNTSFNLQAQTEDIELSTNYYVLSHDGAYKGTAGDNVSVPAYTRYATSATLNKGDTASIAPTTSNTVKYSPISTSVVQVSESGVVTAKASGSAIITSKVLGTIGSRVYTNYPNNPDMMTRTTSVNVSDPSHFGGFNIMSLESNTSTITIPTVNSTQPGYFDDIAVTVSGLANGGTYTNSAIITSTNKTVSVNGSNVSKPVTYTVKYAKANSTFSGYSAISVTADVVSKSIRYSGANRYGYKQWTITPSGDTVPTATTKVDGGIETATTKGITLLGKTYSEVFEPYTYVDVTFTFDYYTYKTKRTVFKLDDEGNKIPKRNSEGAIIEGEYETEEKEFYQYDADYIDPNKYGVAGYSDNDNTNDREDRNNKNPNPETPDTNCQYFDETMHDHQTYTVTDFEIRNKSAANLANKSQTLTVAEAAAAIADMPDNDYYSYRLNASTIKTPTANGAYKANVTVELLHAPKKYVVKLNGSNVKNGNDGSRNKGTNNYFYQEYTTLSSGDSMNWCVTDVNNTSTGTPLATGKSYRFRVAGNTYIKSVAASIADADFNRSKVTNAGQQITHEKKSSTNQTIVEKLTNNFYISDFFVPEFVKNERDVQEDDVKFVGGGVVYYQVKDGVVDSKVEDAGYADSSGVGVKSSIADFIQEKIEEASVPAEIQGDDLRNEIAYGTEIAATADSTTGLRYRYLPYNVFTRDNGVLSTGLKDEVSGNVLVQQLDANNNPVTRTVDGETVPVYYTFATETSSDTFRYSNTLRAYQYIYADKKENKATNAGKNMRLYAYYIYSYTDYDKDTGIPSTVYKVVLSNEYADASTYWNNTNTNN
ncbi:MAG: InlB B-repeat-containing protein [Ruminococcus sp.]|nr:InlB B-repeat-containing protein [Ruminococcus sp.]